ncbi:bifunctional diaminohydroxyphosphoribosylaminopyrimidine deaminase/5-amino-6-(5-phosphoribosylamino)uracil reductase RibD [Roseivivax halotolerans]
MRRALRLAGQKRGYVWPNPPVGCVIVRDNRVVAEAATHAGGRPHAERKALDQAGVEARGATLFVTLEPCCHWGVTPPCADAIVDAGVARVVCAVGDPDPRVNGGGFERLRAAGVDVEVGLCADEAARVLSGFFHRVRHGVPDVVVVERTLDRIPTCADALLVSSTGGMRLATRRSGTMVITPVPEDRTDAVLIWMGELGLTTVAVLRGDPASHFIVRRGSSSLADRSEAAPRGAATRAVS